MGQRAPLAAAPRLAITADKELDARHGMKFGVILGMPRLAVREVPEANSADVGNGALVFP